MRRDWDKVPDSYADNPAGRRLLLIALALIPFAACAGVGMDFGMSFMMRQRLDAVAQSALASALAQSRALRDGHSNVSVEEMELKGRGRSDLVFNAQKPNLRDIRTTFTLTRQATSNVFDAKVTYVASINTTFLRFVGVRDLDVAGEAVTTWVARDALIDEDFDEQQVELAGLARKLLPAQAGWQSDDRTRGGQGGVIQLAVAERYPGPPPPKGVKIALELDTENGNTAVSRKVSLEPGAHQLRYWYRDRVENDRTLPAWLCGTREDDIEWMTARDQGRVGGTNRMSVYLSAATGPAPPPAMTLNASTRVDSCYSSGYRWIQRAVKIDILSRGDYWLTFRGEGRPDGIGAAIANILFCREPCADEGVLPPPTSNYPWRPGELLFEDRFTSSGLDPLATSPGQSGGWAYLPPGWTVWPGRSVNDRAGPGGLPGFVELDAASGDGFENARMGRAFLLTPGFYQLRYVYSVGPNSPHKAIACNYFGLEAALQRIARVAGADTHRINVIIDPDRPYLHPELTGADMATRSGTTEALTLNWFSAGRVLERDTSGVKRQALPDMSNTVDFCAGAPPGVGVNREISFRIDQAGLYWITFAAEGPADGEGGRIAAVQLFATGTSYSGQGIPRIIRTTERGDITTPPPGALLIQPPASLGQRALYRVQVQ